METLKNRAVKLEREIFKLELNQRRKEFDALREERFVALMNNDGETLNKLSARWSELTDLEMKAYGEPEEPGRDFAMILDEEFSKMHEEAESPGQATSRPEPERAMTSFERAIEAEFSKQWP